MAIGIVEWKLMLNNIEVIEHGASLTSGSCMAGFSSGQFLLQQTCSAADQHRILFRKLLMACYSEVEAFWPYCKTSNSG